MKPETFNDPLGNLSPLIREIYELAEQSGDVQIKARCLRLYTEVAKARKALGLTDMPVGLLNESGRA
ncbi:MAG TPA: hypothetical protein VG897_08255 [Terriglobales bacterium]|nr:hypothetical protein [Terriglobales bacterium]